MDFMGYSWRVAHGTFFYGISLKDHPNVAWGISGISNFDSWDDPSRISSPRTSHGCFELLSNHGTVLFVSSKPDLMAREGSKPCHPSGQEVAG